MTTVEITIEEAREVWVTRCDVSTDLWPLIHPGGSRITLVSEISRKFSGDHDKTALAYEYMVAHTARPMEQVCVRPGAKIAVQLTEGLLAWMYGLNDHQHAHGEACDEPDCLRAFLEYPGG